MAVIEVLCVFFATFAAARGLECGINVGESEQQFRELTNLCAAGSSIEVPSTPPTSSEEDYEAETPRAGFHANTAQRAEGDGSGEALPTPNPNDSDNRTALSEQCAVQCIFDHLGLTDTNGYPEHRKILEALLKNSEGRELRDFLQDSTDECFKFMKQADTMDSCIYSTLLVTCLAEKGRTNCGDWPVGNLPFQ